MRVGRGSRDRVWSEWWRRSPENGVYAGKNGDCVVEKSEVWGADGRVKKQKWDSLIARP
jgi:hypothetical protein